MSSSSNLPLLRRLLLAVVRVFVARSIPFQMFVRLGKEVYIQAAEEELKKSTTKINVSRLSALTGLHRYDVQKIQDAEGVGVDAALSVLSQVVGLWTHHPHFTTSRGKPRVLSLSSENDEFKELVENVSKALNPSTILFELERSKAVERSARGLKLVVEQVWTGPEAEAGLSLLARDLNSIVMAVEENLKRLHAVPNLHIRTEYDNIYLSDLPKIRSWLAKQGQAFHRKARTYLSKYDKDVGERGKKGDRDAGASVVLTAFSHIVVPDEVPHEE